LRDAYARIRAKDRRWATRYDDIEVLINPNGPLFNGGSDGDNGQTGRKLVMDYYGPRVAIGGGALSGKDMSHIDRAGAYAARHAALHAVQTGAGECRVTVAYAPNRDVPLDVVYEMDQRAEQLPAAWFAHSAVRERYRGGAFVAALGRGGHFIDAGLPWNQVLRVTQPVTPAADNVRSVPGQPGLAPKGEPPPVITRSESGHPPARRMRATPLCADTGTRETARSSLPASSRSSCLCSCGRRSRLSRPALLVGKLEKAARPETRPCDGEQCERENRDGENEMCTLLSGGGGTLGGFGVGFVGGDGSVGINARDGGGRDDRNRGGHVSDPT